MDINKDFFTYRSDIILLEDEQAVVEAIKNIIKNYKYEVPFNESGSDIKELLLKEVFYVRKADILIDLQETINKYVDDVSVDDIITDDTNVINIILIYNKKEISLVV